MVGSPSGGTRVSHPPAQKALKRPFGLVLPDG